MMPRKKSTENPAVPACLHLRRHARRLAGWGVLSMRVHQADGLGVRGIEVDQR